MARFYVSAPAVHNNDPTRPSIVDIYRRNDKLATVTVTNYRLQLEVKRSE